jgi:hypothetical protein
VPFRTQSTRSRPSICVWTIQSEKEVLALENTQPNLNPNWIGSNDSHSPYCHGGLRCRAGLSYHINHNYIKTLIKQSEDFNLHGRAVKH